MGEVCATYLKYIDSPGCTIRYKDKFVRDLYRLATKLDTPLFLTAVERALKYQVTSVASVERIAAQVLQPPAPPLLPTPLNEHYEERTAYQAGRFSSEANLASYQRLLEQEDHDER